MAVWLALNFKPLSRWVKHALASRARIVAVPVETASAAFTNGSAHSREGGAMADADLLIRTPDNSINQPSEHDEMVWIPGGTFRMGSDRHYPEEAPVHRVTVDGFWIDRAPV